MANRVAWWTCKHRVGCALFLSLIAAFPCAANELRIVDSFGLIRGVKAASALTDVLIIVNARSQSQRLNVQSGIECRATNVDGLAVERSSIPDSNNRCVFKAMPAGVWKIEVVGAKEWKVSFSE